MEISQLNSYNNNNNFLHFGDLYFFDSIQLNEDEDYMNRSEDYYYPYNYAIKLDNDSNNKDKITSNENGKIILKSTEIKVESLKENIHKSDVKINFKISKIKHPWDSYDLVQRKLQVYFINFLIGLANDAIKSFFKGKNVNIEFKNILYSKKKKAFNEEKIKEIIYKDIFYLPISPKNKGEYIQENTNEKIYSSFCCKYSLLKDFFDQTYLFIFENYYYENKKIINFQGLNISLTEKTKTFDYLLNKRKNKSIKDLFLNVVDRLYFKIKRGSNI